MDSPRVVYRPAPDATPEGEIRALAQAYSFILRTHEGKKKGAEVGAPGDVRKDQQSAHTVKTILPRRR